MTSRSLLKSSKAALPSGTTAATAVTEPCGPSASRAFYWKEAGQWQLSLPTSILTRFALLCVRTPRTILTAVMRRPLPPIAPDMDSPEPVTSDDYAEAAE